MIMPGRAFPSCKAISGSSVSNATRIQTITPALRATATRVIARTIFIRGVSTLVVKPATTPENGSCRRSGTITIRTTSCAAATGRSNAKLSSRAGCAGKDPTVCYACHRNDDVHKGVLGEKCEKLPRRDQVETEPLRPRSRQPLPLREKHRTAKCGGCHKDARLPRESAFNMLRMSRTR